jgi:hypothetical protein
MITLKFFNNVQLAFVWFHTSEGPECIASETPATSFPSEDIEQFALEKYTYSEAWNKQTVINIL